MAAKALGPAMAELVAAVEAVTEGPMLVGCSGGADSLALVAACAVVAKRRGLQARALVIDHGLQKGSGDVAKKAASRAEKVGLPADVVSVEVVDDGSGPEASARKARHATLEAVATSVSADVFVGHTMDDQAETVLLGLARGSGARSLSGMSVRRGLFVRPFLGIRRKVTEAACDEVGVKFWRDPHNEDPSYARVRVRKTVLPVLEKELGPGITEALSRTSDLLRDDSDFLDALAAEADCDTELDLELVPAHPAVRRRVLRRWLLERGALEPAYGHILAVDSLITDWHGQKWIEVPGLKVHRTANTLRILED